ncbi:hypothetical protein ON010_g4715 [Phytophthora cinnamomi]|nr:hypothetical protein ON010_g4715 [Phytophthora cinnamomi]
MFILARCLILVELTESVWFDLPVLAAPFRRCSRNAAASGSGAVRLIAPTRLGGLGVRVLSLVVPAVPVRVQPPVFFATKAARRRRALASFGEHGRQPPKLLEHVAVASLQQTCLGRLQKSTEAGNHLSFTVLTHRVVGGGVRPVRRLVPVRPVEGPPVLAAGRQPVERGHPAHAPAEAQQEEENRRGSSLPLGVEERAQSHLAGERLEQFGEDMTTPFENPSKIANNVKSGKWTTPLLVAAGVGAAAWYMVSKRDHKPASPDRDPGLFKYTKASVDVVYGTTLMAGMEPLGSLLNQTLPRSYMESLRVLFNDESLPVAWKRLETVFGQSNAHAMAAMIARFDEALAIDFASVGDIVLCVKEARNRINRHLREALDGVAMIPTQYMAINALALFPTVVVPENHVRASQHLGKRKARGVERKRKDECFYCDGGYNRDGLAHMKRDCPAVKKDRSLTVYRINIFRSPMLQKPVPVAYVKGSKAAAKIKAKAARVEIPVDAVMIRQIKRAKKVAVAQVTRDVQETRRSDTLTPEQAKADVDALMAVSPLTPHSPVVSNTSMSGDDDVEDVEPSVVPALAGKVSEASGNIEVAAKAIEEAMAPNAGGRMGISLQQQGMGAPSPSSNIGGIGGLGSSIPAPTASRQAAVAPSAIVPTTKSTTTSRALATSSNNGGSSDEDGNMAEDDAQKKKERRRQQVRYASRRRRKKQKDEESFLRDRIAELKEQIRIIGGDLTEQCSQMAGMSEQALTEAYEKQMQTVQTLRKDNNKLKEQLLQHENFARMIQYGLNALPSDCRDVDRKKIAGVPMWISDQMNPLKGPTLVVDLNLCHEAVRHAYNELKTFGPSVNSKTNVCYAMGWKTELWAASTCLNFRAVRPITDKNIREVADASWEIITSPDKFKRIYPDVKQFRILQKVTDDIVVVHRIASVASDMSDREFISVAFRFRDGDNYFIGIKSITVQTEAAENCIRGEECQGWMFVGGENETSQWKAHFLGYYDVKGEKDDKVLNQLANEAMFGMLRWESEAMHPLSV